MSWNVTMYNIDDKVVEFDEPVKQVGGNICLSNTHEAEISGLTYNYSHYYYKYLNNDDGLRFLDGMYVEQSIPYLEKAIDALDQSTEKPDDYWASTEGNARKPLVEMLEWARKAPDGAYWSIQ